MADDGLPVLGMPSAPVPPAPIEQAEFEFAAEVVTVSESATVVGVVIDRLGVPSGRAMAVWWIEQGTATENEDYASLGIRLEMFEEGESTRTTYVPIVADSLAERAESFYVNLPGRAGPQVPEQAKRRMRVTIVDDDSCETPVAAASVRNSFAAEPCR
jgi:hypothetical protein